jgi:hypothetical protein
MIKKLFSWAMGAQTKIEPLYASREVWLYQHTDAKTGARTHKPVLVFRKASEGMFWGLPLSNVGHKSKPLYVPRIKNGKRLSPLSQMRTLKAERLVRKLGKAEEKEFAALSRAVIRLLVENDPILRYENRPRRRHAVSAMPRTTHSRQHFVPAYIFQPRYA